MLVSPLLGPIFGIGLGLGTNDTRLLKYGAQNLAVMVAIALIASFVYFLITPLNLSDPTELEARTSPTIYDVLIALFGGLAGIFEMSRKESGTVLAGVAIATALMPPLCTAGYGLANWNLEYFAGAMYLFIINSVFIIFATYVMVKYMNFQEAEFANAKTAKRTRNLITFFILLVIIPSIWSAWGLIKENNFKQNVTAFVADHKTFERGYIYDYSIDTRKGMKATIHIAGATLTPEIKADMLASAVEYGIPEDKLSIKEHNMFSEEANQSERLMRGIYERTDAELNRKELQIRAESQLNAISSLKSLICRSRRKSSRNILEIQELYLTRGAVETDSLKENRCLLVVAKRRLPFRFSFAKIAGMAPDPIAIPPWSCLTRSRMRNLLSAALLSLLAIPSLQAQPFGSIPWPKPLRTLPDTATLVFLGDIMMHQNQIDHARQADGTYNFQTYFKNLEKYLQEADVAVANMEFTLAGEPYTGYPSFSAPDNYPDEAAVAGVNIFLTANNHILDKGRRGSNVLWTSTPEWNETGESNLPARLTPGGLAGAIP